MEPAKEMGNRREVGQERKNKVFMYEYHNKTQFCMLAKILNKDISLNFDSKFYCIFNTIFPAVKNVIGNKAFYSLITTEE